MNAFLRSGQKGSGDGSNDQNKNSEGSQPKPDDCDVQMDAETTNEAGDESSALTEIKMITSNQPKISIDIDNVLEMIEKSENGGQPQELQTAIKTDVQPKHSDTGSTSCNSKSNNESNKRGLVAGADPTKPLQPKAKLLRQQRKSEKLLKLSNSSTESSAIAIDSSTTKKPPKSMEKNLQAFIDETPTDGKYNLKVFIIIFYFSNKLLEYFCYSS